MPNFDGTGSMGQGAMTGRRRGRCKETGKADTQNQSTENKEIIYGLGRGGKPRCGEVSGNRFGGGFGNGQG